MVTVTFTPVFCSVESGDMTKEEIEGVGYQYADLSKMLERYDPTTLVDGFNTMADGETIFYISNPALGLWAYRGRFEDK